MVNLVRCYPQDEVLTRAAYDAGIVSIGEGDPALAGAEELVKEGVLLEPNLPWRMAGRLYRRFTLNSARVTLADVRRVYAKHLVA